MKKALVFIIIVLALAGLFYIFYWEHRSEVNGIKNPAADEVNESKETTLVPAAETPEGAKQQLEDQSSTSPTTTP